ncbi:rod shape-determining protein MreD [endosymbiont of Ridgeia piscesae]|jgi:rod shape-determining protein MreD|uniref:Rod shape-determining protein MreD n=1 Tax=endosymbiont of Ridgeia piscesae TaxID=54398 RepID=A0A0T5YT86_9GAMM|nr:rod shape-determining protein MreD [endosymbiont of Ridgeia piscesae]KRT53819.1 rod shape-determining protein MreD [endosymbiont of Ridgeia piscesae]KRT59258.1 rod shape-determining protein MreD [endosymbiont of Ridgeia piscesae]
MNANVQGRLYIAHLTLAFGFVLAVMPMPDWASNFRPQWVTLILIYWCMALPERVNVGTGWLAGLLLDVLSGSLLGQHALALAVVSFLTLNIYQRVRVLPLRQQMFTIMILLLVEKLLALWATAAAGYPAPTLWYWAAPLVGMLLWPWIYIILRDIRRRFHVS